MYQTALGKAQTAIMLVVIVVAAAAVAFSILVPPTQQEDNEIAIGAIFPLSGSDASTGRDITVALELAAEIINNQYDLDMPLARTEGVPNLGGAKVRIIIADSTGDPATGRAEAERLITEEKVVALTGAWHSAVTRPASAVAEESGIPFVNGASTEPALTDRGFTWFFRTTPHDRTFSEAMLRFAKEVNETNKLNLRTVMIVSVDNEWGVSAVEAEERFANEMGFAQVETLFYSSDSDDVSSEALRVTERNPDVIIHNSYTTDAILFTQEYKRLNWFPKLFLAQDAGFETAEFSQTMGRDADFIVSRSAWAGLDNTQPLVDQVNELYKTRHPEGADMDGQTAREFTAFLVVADAINRAGSTKPEKIRQALAEADWPAESLVTGWDGVNFDATGQNSKATPAMLQRQDGRWRTVWPSEIAPVKAHVPAPNWDLRS
jgi:branched-chain amino acid transport system substrate-binding protein